MATEEENLAELLIIRTNVIANLKELTLSPKPNYTIDGQKVDWTDYQKMLMDQLKSLNALIQALDGPYEVTSTIYT